MFEKIRKYPWIFVALFLAYLFSFNVGNLMKWGLPLLFLFTLKDQSSPRTSNHAFQGIERAIGVRTFLLFCVSLTFTVCIAKIFRYEALESSLWDFAQYLQITYRKAWNGTSDYTLNGKVVSYDLIHRTWSLPIIAWFYSAFDHPWVLFFWNAIFLVTPGVILSLWYRSLCKTKQITPSGFGYLLCFLLYIWSPVFSGQIFWPYSFHILGISLFALSYLFYFEKKWNLWAGSLILFAFEKEEFGIYATAFALLVLIESFFEREDKQAEPSRIQSNFSWVVLLAGVYSYLGFALAMESQVDQESVVKIGDRFGEFGGSALSVLWGILSNPGLVLEKLTRPASLRFLGFFGAISLFWISPKWRVLKYLIPVLPVTFLNSLSNYRPMIELRDHYALPIFVGAAACAVFGVIGGLSVNQLRKGRGYLYIFLILAISAQFGIGNPFRKLRKSAEVWAVRETERDAVSALKGDKNLIVCCQGRLCSAVADRPLAIRALPCSRGAEVLNELVGKQAIYLIYRDKLENAPSAKYAHLSQNAFVPVPNQWKIETDLLKISHPITIEKKTISQ